MALRLSEEFEALLARADADLRPAAEAMGLAALGHLERLRPRLADDGEAGSPVLEALDLEREGAPDPLSLVACIAAHRSYAAGRGRPDAVSVGGLAIARLLVWAERAALLGEPPRLVWIGPPARAPDRGEGQAALTATCRLTVDGVPTKAAAVAVVERQAA